MGLLGRMARRGTRTGGQASYAEQSLRQSKLDTATISSMKRQLAKMYASVYAWWRLTPQQKKMLDDKRESGMFGGEPGKAPYMWVQEGSINSAGAVRAGIHPTAFVENALSSSEGLVSDAIAGVLSAG
jgi:hypothetical protein